MTTPAPGTRSRPARAAAVCLGLLLSLEVVGLHLAFHRHAGPLWRDEATSVNLASMPSFADVFANIELDSFPAVWAMALHAWIATGLGDTDLGLRRFGLSIGLATVAALWWAGWRLGIGPPLVGLLLFGMSPTTIVYGDEVRGYGLAALALVWCFGAIWQFVRRPT